MAKLPPCIQNERDLKMGKTLTVGRSFWRSGLMALILAECVLLTGCGPSNEELAGLAGQGQVESSAPVQARSSAIFDASLPRVWCILTDVADWRSWQPDIQAVSGLSSLEKDSSFSWRTDGMNIRATVVRWQPPRQIAWVGKVSIAKAIHVFTLTPWGPDKTEVVSRESMDGPLLSWFYSSDDLKNTNDKQLANMAAAARDNLRPGCPVIENAHR
jgi:hypothetical protein